MSTHRIHSELSSTIRTVARLREQMTARKTTLWEACVLRLQCGYHQWTARTLRKMLRSARRR